MRSLSKMMSSAFTLTAAGAIAACTIDPDPNSLLNERREKAHQAAQALTVTLTGDGTSLKVKGTPLDHADSYVRRPLGTYSGERR